MVNAYRDIFTGTKVDFCTCKIKSPSLIAQFTKQVEISFCKNFFTKYEVDAYRDIFTGTKVDFCTCKIKSPPLIAQFTKQVEIRFCKDFFYKVCHQLS